MLDRFGIKPSVALGTEAAKRYPELVDALLRRNACFMAHGDYATRRITSRMQDERGRDHRRRVMASPRRLGRPQKAGADRISMNPPTRRRGSSKPGFNTPPIGRMTTGRICSIGSLVALPPQPEWNDLECMWLRRVTPPVWQANIVEAFEVLHAEGGNVFNLTLHPWIAGQAHRIRYLRDALHHILGKPQVWRATTDEVAEVARAQLSLSRKPIPPNSFRIAFSGLGGGRPTEREQAQSDRRDDGRDGGGWRDLTAPDRSQQLWRIGRRGQRGQALPCRQRDL